MEVVFVNVLILFMLLFLGFILGRKKIIAYSSIKDLTNLLIDVSIPCTIVVSLIRPYSSLLMKNTGEVFVVVMVYHLAVAAIAYFLSGVLKVDPKRGGPGSLPWCSLITALWVTRLCMPYMVVRAYL